MIIEKSLVLYKGRPAQVTGVDDKITITLADGEKLRVREKDVELLHEGPSPKAADLEKMTLSGDIDGARELLEGTEFPLSELSELAFGSFTAETAWAAWLLLKDGLYFSGTIAAMTCRSGTEVSSEREKREGKGREAAEREAFLQRLRKNTIDIEADARRMQDVEALALGKSDKSRTMKDLGREESPAAAHKLLLDTGYWKRDFNPHPSRFGQLLRSASLPVPPPPAEERLDLRHLPAFAIDNAWSEDPDDAISWDGKSWWVHVADPASAILADSPVDLEARGRGETLYLPEGVYRMIAEESLPLFALGLSSSSPALSFQITLDDEDSIAEVAIHRTSVSVTRLTYEGADAKRESPELAPFFEVAAHLEQRRLKNGAIAIELPETHIAVRAGEISIDLIPPSKAADMVREFMVLAGAAAAQWALRNQIPFPFVVQEVGDRPADPLPGLAGSYQLRRCMRPRRLQTQPGAHGGLGLSMYTQVTSPLRRYTDLLAHQQIRAVLAGGQPLSTDDVIAHAAAADQAARQAVLAERTSRQHWTLLYLEKNREKVWDATIVEKKGGRAVALIEEIAWEVQVAYKGEAELNARIGVKLSSTDLCALTAQFTAAE